MSIVQQLGEYAAQLAEQNQQRRAGLERELGDLQVQIAQKQAMPDTLGFGHQRLANFQVKIGPDYQCPRCWIMLEKRSALRPIGGGTNTEDFFRCNDCDSP